ncbi:MAG: ribonuclease P protein component [Christensenellales bacterium]
MLARKNRLKKKKEFSYIYRKGESYYSSDLTLFACKTKLASSKVGFSVSNKVGNSAIRHKVKRRLSEIVRLRINRFPIKNYILVAKPTIVSKTFHDLEKQVEILFEKVKS